VVRSPYLQDRAYFFSWRAMYLLHWPLVLLALAASLLLVRRPERLRLPAPALVPATAVAGVLAYAIAFHYAVAPFPRYNVPFRPLVYLLAALALQAAWRARANRSAAPLPAATS